MTNKETVEQLTTKLNIYYFTDEDNEALDIAIKALEFQDKVKEACCSLFGFELVSYIRRIVKEADNG